MYSFFFTGAAQPDIYTLSLHDALPISDFLRQPNVRLAHAAFDVGGQIRLAVAGQVHIHLARSEEHTSELQSRGHLVCRLLLENKNLKLCPVDLMLLNSPQLHFRTVNYL